MNSFDPFIWATGLIVLILVFELAGLIIGLSLSDVISSLVSTEAFSQESWLNWAVLKGIPLMVALCVILGVFVCLGFLGQLIYSSFTGSVVNSWILAALVAYPAVIIAKLITPGIRPLFEGHSTALTHKELVGSFGTVTSHDAMPGELAEVSVVDRFGNTHYLPAKSEVPLKVGESVLISSVNGFIFNVSK